MIGHGIEAIHDAFIQPVLPVLSVGSGGILIVGKNRRAHDQGRIDPLDPQIGFLDKLGDPGSLPLVPGASPILDYMIVIALHRDGMVSPISARVTDIVQMETVKFRITTHQI